jgi:hypothetical protein
VKEIRNEGNNSKMVGRKRGKLFAHSIAVPMRRMGSGN